MQSYWQFDSALKWSVTEWNWKCSASILTHDRRLRKLEIDLNDANGKRLVVYNTALPPFHETLIAGKNLPNEVKAVCMALLISDSQRRSQGRKRSPLKSLLRPYSAPCKHIRAYVLR